MGNYLTKNKQTKKIETLKYPLHYEEKQLDLGR